MRFTSSLVPAPGSAPGRTGPGQVEAVDGYVAPLLLFGPPNTAAFMAPANDGDKPVALVAAGFPEAGRRAAHPSVRERGDEDAPGGAHRDPRQGLPSSSPASLHIMLFEVRELSQGTLPADPDPGRWPDPGLSLPVKPVEPMKGMQH